MIYTSGSTGTPKGVVVTHRALAARVGWMREEYGLGPADRVLQFASVSFDTHAEEIYPAWRRVRRSRCCPAAAVILPDFLAGAEGARLTVLDLPTPYWHELVADIDARRLAARAAPGDPRGRPGATAGGPGLAPALRATGSGWSTPTAPPRRRSSPPAAELRDSDERPPIGRPIAETSAYVLDERQATGPGGSTRRAVHRRRRPGPRLPDRPELTAERFVPDPYGQGARSTAPATGPAGGRTGSWSSSAASTAR